MDKKPPRLAKLILKWIANKERKSNIIGDFEEEFYENLQQSGYLSAYLKYWILILISLPSFLFNIFYWGVKMFFNYLKTSIRNLRKNKSYAFINITGLAVGLVSCLLIILYVNHELSFDKFHSKSDQIFRVNLRYNVASNKFDVPLGPFPLAETLKEEYPEVKAATKIFFTQYRSIKTYVKKSEDFIFEPLFLWVDADFFKIFDVEIIAGEKENLLSKPNTVVITDEMADKYFGNIDVVGKPITLHNNSQYFISAVVKKFPNNSHFQFDFLASFETLPHRRIKDFYDTACYNYILLDDPSKAEEFNKKLPQLSKKYISATIERLMGTSYDEFIKAGNFFGFFIEPLLDIHLYSNVSEDALTIKGNSETVYIFSLIAMVILIVACINFINLSTAKSIKRAGEIGIRKAIGSSKNQIKFQFLAETFVTSAISFVIALIIAAGGINLFNELLGINIPVENILKPEIISLFLGLLIITALFAGFYPAFVLSSFNPVDIINGKKVKLKSSSLFKNLLVVFQFSASIVLIIATIVVYQQVDFLANKNLGFDKDQVVVVHSADRLRDKQKVFKQEIKKEEEIVNATYTDSLPIILLEIKTFKNPVGNPEESFTFLSFFTDYDFIDTYDIKMQKGRFFKKEFSTDSSAIVVNNAALRLMEIKDFKGSQITFTGRRNKDLNIIGVFDDFHIESLHSEIKPVSAILTPNLPGKFLSVRIAKNKIKEGLEILENKWSEFVPDRPFDYEFYDDRFSQLYANEERYNNLIKTFAIIAILIASLGLFGLSSLIIQARTKEICIRKIIGADLSELVKLLSKNFIAMILITNLIAFPIAYLIMSNWLQGYAYRITLSADIFIYTFLLSLILAIATISYNVVRAVKENPADVIRYE